MSHRHAVFITGSGSGFGFGLAVRLLSEGHQVVATEPGDPDARRERLRGVSTEGQLWVEQLDVSDAAAVSEGCSRVVAKVPVNVLVNNGGYAIFG